MIGNLFFWNVRGINETDKHSAFRRWLHVHKVNFGALSETHIKETNLTFVMNSVCPR